MKRLRVCLATLVFSAVPARAQAVDIGASVVDGKLAGFSFAISSHYGVPEPEVVRFRQRYRLHDEDLPVLFFKAARVRVAPSAVMELRAGGLSWLDITFHYGLTPEVFYVPVTMKRVGPPARGSRLISRRRGISAGRAASHRGTSRASRRYLVPRGWQA